MLPASYQDLKNQFSHIYKLRAALSLLHADMQTAAPPGAKESQSQIISSLAETVSTLTQNPKIADLIQETESHRKHMPLWDQRNLDLMKREWQEASAVPSDLIGEYHRVGNACTLAWEEAKPKSDFKAVEEPLKRLLFLTRDIAQAKKDAYLPDRSTYEVLIHSFDPNRRVKDLDALFGDLQEFLPNFAEQVMDRQKSKGGNPITSRIPQSRQLDVCRKMADIFGFDMNHGRLAEYTHPFSSGTPDYTWFVVAPENEDFFNQCYSASAHELGHALYTQGTPEDYRFQPVGEDAGIMIHETQSLLMERHVAKSADFLGAFLPTIKEVIGPEASMWSVQDALHTLEKVEKSFIRIEADEITYPLHVIVRYRLEKALVEGDLSVHDLPGAWNDLFHKLLGITPPDHRRGCLQDIHWFSTFGIGYFPSYTYGAVNAAQIFQAALKSSSDVGEGLKKANTQPLLQWLRENIHDQGNLYEPDVLIEKATGKRPGTSDFKSHLKQTYF